MNKIRICFVTKFVKGIHSYTGGMETHVDDLVRNLIKDKNIEISIITSRRDSKKGEEIPGIKYYYVKESIGKNPLSRYKFFSSVAKKLEEVNYEKLFDVIHLQSDFGVGYFQYLKKKLPIISTVHGTTFNEFKGSILAKPYLFPIWALAYPFYKKTEKNMLKNSDKIICVSEILRRDLEKQYPFVKGKTKTIFNGVNLNYFSPIQTKESKEIKNKYGKDDFLILSAGNMIKQKGYHLVIQAFPGVLRKNPKVKLLIVGDGDYINSLKDLTKKLHLEKNVFFTGRVKREELVNYYRAADSFVFPTLRGEGLPYVLVESMACGNVIITTPNGGRDLINKNTGILVKPKNVLDLQRKILKLIDDKEYYNSLRKNSISLIQENFSVDKMVEENKKVYKEVLKNEKR